MVIFIVLGFLALLCIAHFFSEPIHFRRAPRVVGSKLGEEAMEYVRRHAG